MKFSTKAIFLAAVAAVPFAPAFAQDAPAATQAAAPAAGQVVYDASGAEVGTIQSVADGNFVISTGKNTATLALSSLGSGPKGPVIGMTKVQLDEAIEKASADSAAAKEAALVADAPVFASDGATQLATVGAVEGDNVVLKTADGEVGLPKSAISNGANGLQIGMTAEQFKAAADAAKASAAQ